jgi:tripartite-type tricarboxylate transporter receptor subunit TctC
MRGISVSREIRRRHFLGAAAGAAALSTLPRMALAQVYPARPVHIVVGFPAGLAPEIVARLVGEGLSQRLGQPFVIDDRPGAGTNIATKAVVRAQPDGYTLLLVSSSNAVNASLYRHLSFDFVRDIAPVAIIAIEPFVMVVAPSLPVKTVAEFIAYAKANPRKIKFASPGIGSTAQILGELFRMLTGVDWIHVPYRDSFFPDLLAGQVQVSFATVAESLVSIRAGKLRPLALTTATRSPALPDVPAMADFVPGYAGSGWNGIGAPKGTAADIIDKLNRGISAALADPTTKARLAALGVEPASMGPAEFGKFIAAETEKWAKVVQFANIKAE